MTERALARIVGSSQSHMHNVLKGARKLQLDLADRLIFKLGLDVLDLLEESELAVHLEALRLGLAGPEQGSVARKPAGRETLVDSGRGSSEEAV